MARREMYIAASELKKGDILDMQEVKSKRNSRDGTVSLILIGTTTGRQEEVKWRMDSYHYVTRYTR
ncbi:hypothetical protein IOBOPIKK_00040 [Klebsiella phage vB_KpnS_SCNJ1-C]|nr:hypothetical protein IOBOPIKK_00040 [Klebsiella phage vB_KpnS_SCNJ1-C]